MKKNKILLCFVIFEILLFVFAMFVKINEFTLNSIWASFAMLLISLYAILYAGLFKLDSALYYGTLLFMLSIATAYSFYMNISFSLFYPIYIICIAISHFTVFVFFRQIIHFKLFAFLVIEGILLISYKANLINWWMLVGINGVYLFYLLVNLIFRVGKNLRREQ